MCFNYWANSFMKGDEGVYFSKFPHWKPLLLLKIKIEQNIDFPNKEYNVDFKHFHQNIRAYHRKKKFCIDQWLVKCCILLRRIWARPGADEQIWLVPGGGFGGSRDTREFLQILEYIMEKVFPALKLIRSCYLNMNIAFPWNLAI